MGSGRLDLPIAEKPRVEDRNRPVTPQFPIFGVGLHGAHFGGRSGLDAALVTGGQGPRV